MMEKTTLQDIGQINIQTQIEEIITNHIKKLIPEIEKTLTNISFGIASTIADNFKFSKQDNEIKIQF